MHSRALKESGNQEIIEDRLLERFRASKAVEGLQTFIQNAECNPVEVWEEDEKKRKKILSAKEKLEVAKEDYLRCEKSLQILQLATPDWQKLEAAKSALLSFQADIGLLSGEEAVRSMERVKGHGRGSSGKSFEAACTSVALDLFCKQESGSFLRLRGSHAGRIRVLSNVRLGMASGEIDKMIVLQNDTSSPVLVLAVMECKRNVNDIGYSFLQYQSMLTWLTGDTQNYDPHMWRTKVYRKGHFDKPFLHVEEDGQTFLIAPQSFHEFARNSETNQFVERLVFASRGTCTTLLGLDSQSSMVLASRIALDSKFMFALDTRDEVYFSKLLKQTCESNKAHLTTSDVFEIYLRLGLEDHIVFIDPQIEAL